MIGNANLLSSCYLQIRHFDKVNVNQFAKLWVIHDIAQWQYYQGHEPGGINEQYIVLNVHTIAILRFHLC